MSSDGRIQTAVAISGGNIWTSHDYGVTWVSRATSQFWYSIAMSSDGRIQAAVAQVGNIWTSYATTVTPNPINVLGQSLRVFNATGINSGEFGVFEWSNNGLTIGAAQTQSGFLRDVTLTGRNININASGALNIIDPINITGNVNITGNIITQGTGFFNNIDLSNTIKKA